MTATSVGRACLVSQRPHPGDARVESQVAALRAAGLEVDVLCTRRRSERRVERAARGLVLRLPSPARRRAGAGRYLLEYASFAAAGALALAGLQALRRYRLVYVTNLPDALVFAAGVPKLAGARVILDVRECTPEMLMDRFGAAPDGRAVALVARVEQAAVRFADGVVTCTEPMRAALVGRGADPAKVTVTMNVGPDRLPRPTTENQPASGGFRVVTHGTIIRRYGHEVLIRAMREAVREDPRVELEILGDGPLRPELERLASELGVASHVTFSGFVGRDELLRRLASADCGVVPLLRNPESDLALTLKMFEYLDLGVPVVASRTTAVQSHFGDDELRLVEAGDPEALADALVALAGDAQARARLARAGRAAFERYAPERQRERYVELFARLLSGQGAGGRLAAVVWAPSERRTELLADRLGATLHRVHYLSYKRPLVAPLKYPLQALRTWQLLAAQRPAVVFVTNPPVVAVVCVALYGALTDTPFVMDTHPPALFSHKWGWTLPLQRRLARRALVNVTDQDRFARLIASWGTRCVVVPNPPVVVDDPAPAPDPRFTLAVVNTFAEDEPLEPILEAARRLPAIRFAVTGDTARARRGVLARAPGNVAFTGYLHGSDYWELLGGARAVVALTTFAHSVLGAAQDGVAMGRPLVLSDQPALRAAFSRGAVFTPNSADGLVAAIAQLREREHELRAEVAALRTEHRRGWDERFGQLLTLLPTAP